MAEAENTRKRAEREKANIRKYRHEPLARDFREVGEFIQGAAERDGGTGRGRTKLKNLASASP